MANERLSRDKAAEVLKVSKRTLERLAWLGTGPNYYRLGKRTFYQLSEINRWVAERTGKEAAKAHEKSGSVTEANKTINFLISESEKQIEAMHDSGFTNLDKNEVELVYRLCKIGCCKVQNLTTRGA